MISLLCSFLGALAVSLSSGACKSSTRTVLEEPRQAPVSGQDSAIAALAPKISVDPTAAGYAFNLMIGAGSPASLATVHSLRYFSVVIYDRDNARVDSATNEEILTSGTMSSETHQASITAFATIAWHPARDPGEGAYAIARVGSATGSFATRLPLPAAAPSPKPTKPIVLTLDVQSRAAQAEFILRVQRVGPAPEGEYRPTGERFRIVLQDDVGDMVWSSSEGMVFTQMVGAVEPTEVGKEIEYRAVWNGRDQRTHMLAGPGTFRVTATIPAKPTSYVLREEFTWSGR